MPLIRPGICSARRLFGGSDALAVVAICADGFQLRLPDETVRALQTCSSVRGVEFYATVSSTGETDLEANCLLESLESVRHGVRAASVDSEQSPRPRSNSDRAVKP